MASANGDRRQWDALINEVCFLIKGRENSLIKISWAHAKIRVYVGDDSAVLWTFRYVVE